ncbi:hypothetical protein [Aquimarina algiphila]|uniref:hypothetical protein n=1 Tax=Aquimarina algiphila TaxID=2047982 RepID=UPI00232C93AB|nr:hypothetical protein [Aquimarina algiphila]
MSKENYDTKLTVLEAVSQNDVKPPSTPVDIYLQESEDLSIWVQEDKALLIGKGLNWNNNVLDLPIRAGACRHAQSLWMSERYSQEEAAKIWKEKSPKAYELRNDLLADLRFAYRKRPDLTARVRTIADGTGDADMIQDLSDISALGKANPDELLVTKFDMNLLNKAAQQADALAQLRAKANGATLDNSKAKDIRDRAFTHLKEAVDEIRDTGKYVFRKDPERYKGYISRYKK